MDIKSVWMITQQDENYVDNYYIWSSIFTNYPFFARCPVHLVEENIIDIYFNTTFYDRNNNTKWTLIADLERTTNFTEDQMITQQDEIYYWWSNIFTNYPFFERCAVHLVEENIIDIYFNPSFYDNNNIKRHENFCQGMYG